MSQTMELLKCLNCEASLDVGSQKFVCPQCRAEWPVTGGIPRFFDAPTYYWGEVGRNEARELLKAAREGSWVEAVQSRFSENDDMYFGLLDLQRASWAQMLGLDERSVALDIGSGYGAITHSLSRSVGELYSVEAIPERIEFTQERLRQESIGNVRLIQASATALPLAENSFDLIVTNGVLEWVGEWDLEGDPRSAQVKFLRKIRRLLKDNGVLVIGIENRIGYNCFLGSLDHSGISYTSLMPRKMASFILRHSSKFHHRTQLNPQKEYRTYTYSVRGYRRLLADAGFADVSCHWAEPGYNQPYNIIPLAMPRWVRQQFLDLLDHPSPSPRRSWRRKLKKAVARMGLLPLIVPDFMLFASNRERRSTQVETWVQERLNSGEKANGNGAHRKTTWALYTKSFASKSAVRFGDSESGRDVAFLKTVIGTQKSVDLFEAELTNGKKVRALLRVTGGQSAGVPEDLGRLDIYNTSYSLATPAQGEKLSNVVRQLGYFADMRRVDKDFACIVADVIDLTEALENIPNVDTVEPVWRGVPEEFRSNPQMHAMIEQARYFCDGDADSRPTSIQHGDLSVENIFFDRKTGRIEVIDWADMAGGFPPLFDLFSLFYSTGYLSWGDEVRRFPSEEERWITSFDAIFFSDTRFGQTCRKLILQSCDRLKISSRLIPALLVEFLIIRSNYYLYRANSVVPHRIHVQLLRTCLEGKRSVFGQFPIGLPLSSETSKAPICTAT
jgi:ubiquinone/menaquinone biosynthesis C-methylase UbiE